MTALLTTIDVETAPNPEFAVILMHGLGADANDFIPLVPELRLGDLPAVRFIFPNATEMPVTGNNGYVMRAWYDILSFEGVNRRVDEAGLKASCERIRELIVRENERGIPTSKIFLAGFSQGGAMTYTAGLTHPEKLAGLIVLSGYVPSLSLIDASFSEANRKTLCCLLNWPFKAATLRSRTVASWNGIPTRCSTQSVAKKSKPCACG
jgi:phospholipase/carboxylesterase